MELLFTGDTASDIDQKPGQENGQDDQKEHLQSRVSQVALTYVPAGEKLRSLPNTGAISYT